MALTVNTKLNGKLRVVAWSAETTAANSSIATFEAESAAAVATVHIRGTFGGATVTLLGSLDGTNFIALRDTSGAAISVTSAAYVELSTGFPFIKPNIAGGAGDSLTATMALWGA